MSKLISCPDCHASVSRLAAQCPVCARPIAKSKKKGGCIGRTIKLLIVGAAGILVLGAILNKGAKPPGGGQASVASPAAVAASRQIRVGSEVEIGSTNGKLWQLAATDEAWDRMLDAQNADDTAEIHRMAREGLVYLIPGGTRGKVMQVGVTSFKVRVLDGMQEGKSGWIQRESIRLP